jgi:transcriptional regulator with XRE-family HTH domain
MDKNLIEKRKGLGLRIKELRKEAGITQQELADKTGLKRPNLARIETGKLSTGQDILSKIADVFGKKLDIN